jgi:hypothetical protein
MSERSPSTTRPSRGWAEAARLLAWTLFFLVLMDASTGQFFSRSHRQDREQLSGLTRYFEFGRSAEGTVANAVGDTDANTDPEYVDFLTGCVTDDMGEGLPKLPASTGEPLIAIYGMSFSAQISRTLERIDPGVTVRSLASPSAPPSHVFARYQHDRKQHSADAVVLSLLASSVPYTLTMTGMTWGVEQPFPYTYPRYVLEDGRLHSIAPLIATPDQIRGAIQHPEQWQPFVEQLEELDQYYSPLRFRATLLDESVLVRLCRRAYGQHQVRSLSERTHTPHGFRSGTEAAEIVSAIVGEFAASAQADGRVPIVLLLHDRGYSDHLYRLLKPKLEKDAIPYVSSHELCPTDDPTNFVPDGHFTEAANERIAESILKIVRADVPPGLQVPTTRGPEARAALASKSDVSLSPPRAP